MELKPSSPGIVCDAPKHHSSFLREEASTGPRDQNLSTLRCVFLYFNTLKSGCIFQMMAGHSLTGSIFFSLRGTQNNSVSSNQCISVWWNYSNFTCLYLIYFQKLFESTFPSKIHFTETLQASIEQDVHEEARGAEPSQLNVLWPPLNKYQQEAF